MEYHTIRRNDGRFLAAFGLTPRFSERCAILFPNEDEAGKAIDSLLRGVAARVRAKVRKTYAIVKFQAA